jgi:hypothetical protein
MPGAGYKPATPATKRQQTYALDRAVIGIGQSETILMLITTEHFFVELIIRNVPGRYYTVLNQTSSSSG